MRDPRQASGKPLLERGILKAYNLFFAFEAKDLQHVCVAAFRKFDTADLAIPIELMCTYEDH